MTEEPSPAGALSRLKGMDPARRITIVVLAIVAVLFGWHIAADRATPYSDLGKVDGYIVPVAPQVSGYVTEASAALQLRLASVVQLYKALGGGWPVQALADAD